LLGLGVHQYGWLLGSSLWLAKRSASPLKLP
jgi:hypothetical protein